MTMLKKKCLLLLGLCLAIVMALGSTFGYYYWHNKRVQEIQRLNELRNAVGIAMSERICKSLGVPNRIEHRPYKGKPAIYLIYEGKNYKGSLIYDASTHECLDSEFVHIYR